jgi:hypothetical protein
MTDLAINSPGSETLGPGSDVSSRRGSDGFGRPPYRYPIEEEPMPDDLPFFSSDMEEKLRAGRGVAGTIASHIIQSGVANDALRNILRRAEELENYNPPDRRIVAFVGNSGQGIESIPTGWHSHRHRSWLIFNLGKSSLINALLHERQLATTVSVRISPDFCWLTVFKGGHGEAVTSFVTEYRYSRDSHRSHYVTEIEFLRAAELDRELGQLVDDYRLAHSPDVESRRDITADERDKITRKGRIAEDKFIAAFGAMAGFNLSALEDFGVGGLQRSLHRVRAWGQAIPWPENVSRDGCLALNADTASGARYALAQAMEGPTWPFVKISRWASLTLGNVSNGFSNEFIGYTFVQRYSN